MNVIINIHIYIRLKIYSKFFNLILTKYLENNINLKYLLMDSTISNNKYNNEELKGIFTINKNRKDIKIKFL